jgi:hypothetical protein
MVDFNLWVGDGQQGGPNNTMVAYKKLCPIARVLVMVASIAISAAQPSSAKAQQLKRVADASAGAIAEVSTTPVNVGSDQHGQLVTAVRDGHGNLKLIVWHVSADGRHIRRMGDASAGAISRVALATVDSRNGLVTTAVRDGSGNLKLIVWHISADGQQVERLADAFAGAISEVALVALRNNLVVTAVRDGSGNLKLIAWHISSDGQQIDRRGDALAGAISEVRVVSTISPEEFGFDFDSVVTVVRDSFGDLKLIAWSILDDGMTFERKGDATAGAVSEFDAAFQGVILPPDGQTRSLVVNTAVRDSRGNLKVIQWFVSADAAQRVGRGSSASAGATTSIAVAMARTPFAAERLITAVRDGSGNLELIAWNTDGRPLRREGDASAGAIGDVVVSNPRNNILVTAVRDGRGNLKLIVWRTTDHKPELPVYGPRRPDSTGSSSLD